MHQRGPKQFSLANSAGARATLWKPDLGRIPLAIDNGILTLKGTGVDNYHALVIEQDWGYLVESIISYHYMRGKPSGRSTTELTAARKTRLEIVPQPVPREHHQYETGERWGFQVRFDGRPMAAQTLTLETAHGTTLTGISDAEGRIDFTFPDDFPSLIRGERNRTLAAFTLSTRHLAEGTEYISHLQGEYRPNPRHWRSLGLGVAVAGIGFAAGGLLTGFGRARREESA